MTAEQWFRRMACRRARVNWFRFKRGDVPAAQLKLIQDWTLALSERKTIMLDDSTPQSTGQAGIECERFRDRMGGLDFVLADHLRQFNDRADNETHRLGRVSWGLKMLAKNMETRVICAAQLSRALEGRENKRPDLSDLRDSGEIEENADNVIGLFRPQYYDDKSGAECEFLARKVRDGERGNTGLMEFESAYMNFKIIDRKEYQSRKNES